MAKSENEEKGIRFGSLFGAIGILFACVYTLGFDGIAEIFTLFFMVCVVPVVMVTCAGFALYEPWRATCQKFVTTFFESILEKVDDMEAKTKAKKEETKKEKVA